MINHSDSHFCLHKGLNSPALNSKKVGIEHTYSLDNATNQTFEFLSGQAIPFHNIN
jgi:hypothetical protein